MIREKEKWNLMMFLKKLHHYRTLLFMLLPSAVILFIFAYLPIGGIVLAFKQYRYDLGIWGSKWVGLNNFRFFFLSGQAFRITRNTALYNIAFILVNTSLAISLAIVLNEVRKRKVKKVVQSVIFLPYFISWVIIGSIAYNIFNFENGVLNNLLQSFGQEPLNVYAMPQAWKFIIVGFNALKMVGYSMIVYLAAITGIDAGLYEAAEIDGANIFQRIRHITLPGLRPTMITLILLDVSKIFRGNLDLFYQLVGNNGRLFDTTDVIDTFVFRSLMQSSEVGMAAAAGLYQSVMCFATIMLVNMIVKKVNADYALF